MSTFRLVALVLLLTGMALAACNPPTASPAPATGLPPTGYPVALPTNTSPASGYPASAASPTAPAAPSATQPPQGSPAAEATATVPAPTATTAPSNTPAPTATPEPTATTGPVTIVYRNYEIVPASTTIKAGTQVVFKIEGDFHQPYAGAAAPFIFEAPANLANTTWSITFNNARTMTILCGYHANMTATLIVEP